jgi:hypothetical protein
VIALNSHPGSRKRPRLIAGRAIAVEARAPQVDVRLPRARGKWGSISERAFARVSRSAVHCQAP